MADCRREHRVGVEQRRSLSDRGDWGRFVPIQRGKLGFDETLF